jgi:hypothetical protein
MIVLVLHLPLGWHSTNSNSPSLSFFCQIISPRCTDYTRFSYWIVADVGCMNFGVFGLQGSCWHIFFGVFVTKESREKRIEVFAIANSILFSLDLIQTKHPNSNGELNFDI